MPHQAYEPVPEADWAQFRWGAQWRQSAEDPSSLTHGSSPWIAGRGFTTGCGPGCQLHDHEPQPIDDTEAVMSRVIRRLKLAGNPEVPRMLR